MLALAILAGVVAFLILLLFSPVSVRLFFDSQEDRLCVTVRYLFLFFRLYPSKQPRHSKKKHKSKKQKESGFQKLSKCYGFCGAIKEIASVALEIVRKSLQVLKHAKLQPFRLRLVIGEEDAAATAISYGVVCAALYPVLGLLFSTVKVPNPNVSITADYTGKKNWLSVEGKLSVQCIWLFTALFSALLQYIGQKVNRKEVQNTINKGGVSE